ncbi:MAG: hypothetical protein WBX25_25330 [Rhodomicrobium sp.]
MQRQIHHLFTFGVLILLAAGGFAGASVNAQAKTCPVLASLDSDHDGTLDLAEAEVAASALFERLDTGKDNTLGGKELKGRLAARKVRSNDPDHDGPLDRTEYLAIVEGRFNAADPDKDGTIDCKEVTKRAGRTLLQVLH